MGLCCSRREEEAGCEVTDLFGVVCGVRSLSRRVAAGLFMSTAGALSRDPRIRGEIRRCAHEFVAGNEMRRTDVRWLAVLNFFVV